MNTQSNGNQPPFDIPGIYNEREALIKYLKLDSDRENELVTVQNPAKFDSEGRFQVGLHIFTIDDLIFEVYSLGPKEAHKLKNPDALGSVSYGFNSSRYSISGVPAVRGLIDVEGLYELTLKNGVTKTPTGHCLLHSYLNNKLNKDSVESYRRKDGVWYDVHYDGKKQWAVYAVSPEAAIGKRFSDLKALGRTDPKKLSATRSLKNHVYEEIIA
ncbi:hypothetical protein [Vibrio owensii]|uniref:hypothetical protein n=1 Tax=Vibrio owensii TaxID=696485 RepID=UPI0018F26A0F|nr:hypothetical protein [Vibrio owensii]